MDLDQLLELGNACLHMEPPVCEASCPLHVEVRQVVIAIQSGNFQKAYQILDNKLPFARIIAGVCDHPCEAFCERGAVGGSIKIGELERAVVQHGYTPAKKALALPKKKGRVAVIGGGISGISAALYLNKKGYQVTILEQLNHLGGRLFQKVGTLIDETIWNEELQAMTKQGILIQYEETVTPSSLETLFSSYDAVYLGTGAWQHKYAVDNDTFQVDDLPLFIGGRLVTNTDSIIFSVSTGKRAAISIDRFLSKSSLTAAREREGAYFSKHKQNVSKVISRPPIDKEGAVYQKEEAMKEASRCLQCQCNECIKACVHMQKYEVTPDTYVRKINHNERIIMGTHHANELINACTECGLCKEVCPIDIGMKDIIHETRKSMVSRGKMPPSAHDFAIRDMNYSLSDACFLVHGESNDSKHADYVFYPGCQLSATSPDYINPIYQHLKQVMKQAMQKEEKDCEIGLFLSCCGAPAAWAGRMDLLEAVKEKTLAVWEEMEHPTFILACSSCMSTFETYFPMISTVSLWEILDQYGLPATAAAHKTESKESQILSIHDACATRYHESIHQSIRSLAKKLGYQLTEPTYTMEQTKCCGYGGLVSYANPAQAKLFGQDQTINQPHPLLVYCAMCKDSFIRESHSVYHILDLIYGTKDANITDKKMPSLSMRQNNRKLLKYNLQRELWKEETPMNPENELNLNIVLSDETKVKMEQRFILLRDIEEVIAHSIKHKERFYNTKTSDYLAAYRMEQVTYWVQYEERADILFVKNVYSHRMEIVEEQ